MLRINDDGEQDQITTQILRKAFLQLSQVIDQAKAISGIRTPHIGKAENHNLTLQLRKRNFVSSLIGQHKIGHGLLTTQNGARSDWIGEFAYDGKPPRFQRFLLQILIAVNSNIFRVRGISIHHQREINSRSRLDAVQRLGFTNVERHGHRIHVARNAVAGHSHGSVRGIDGQYKS